MIPAGLLDRLRLRARCYALRVRWVDELEQQRDDARGRARAAEVERDRCRNDLARVSDLATTRQANHAMALGEVEDGIKHWRREVAALTALPAEGTSDEELLAKLQRRVNGVPGSPGAILGAWQQVCRLVDPDGDLPLSPASIVDRVAVLIEQQKAVDDADAEIQDAETVWSGAVAPGGYVCGACGMPVESEPCAEHQPKALAAMRAPYDPAMGGDIEPPPGRAFPGQCGDVGQRTGMMLVCTSWSGHPLPHMDDSGVQWGEIT